MKAITPRHAIGLTSLALALVLAATRVCPVAHASDRAGVYGVIERVVLEPGETAPERIQVFGTFALSKRDPAPANSYSPGIYSPASKGYLYFSCAKPSLDACRRQWQDLQQAAGQAKCVSFGDRYTTDPKPNAKLRAFDEPPTSPDDFPLGIGVNVMDIAQEGVCHDAMGDAVLSAVSAPATAPTTEAYPASGSAPATSEPYVPPAQAGGQSKPPADAGNGSTSSNTTSSDAAGASGPGGQTIGGSGGLGTNSILLALAGLVALTLGVWTMRRRGTG